MVELIILGVVVAVGVIAYGLHRHNKAVTAASVLAVAEADAKADAAKVETAVANTVATKL